MGRGYGDEYADPEITEYGSIEELTNQAADGGGDGLGGSPL
jgi:hypothetical protein